MLPIYVKLCQVTVLLGSSVVRYGNVQQQKTILLKGKVVACKFRFNLLTLKEVLADKRKKTINERILKKRAAQPKRSMKKNTNFEKRISKEKKSIKTEKI